jgi:curved DNA-binding protein CbpA
MPAREGEIQNIAHAYRVLDVPHDASSRAIKSSYRKLVKRWHPDRYRPGSEQHAEATQMTSLINAAYARIQDAPLRAGYAMPFSNSRGSRDEAASDPPQPQPSGASHAESVSRESGISDSEFLRVLANARQAGARDDSALPSYGRGTILRVIFGAGVGALFGLVAHPRSMRLSNRMAVIQMICGALLVGLIVVLDRRRI